MINTTTIDASQWNLPGATPTERAIALFERAIPIADAPGEMRWIGTRADDGKTTPILLTLLRSLFDGTPQGVHVAIPSATGEPRFDFLGNRLNCYASIHGHTNILTTSDVDARLALIDEPCWVEGEYADDSAPPLSLDCPAIWKWRESGSWDARTCVRGEVSA